MSELGRVLILGANGQVGRELQRSFAGAGELLCPGRDQADLASPEKLRDLVRSIEPDLILNAAAYTAVDRAEAEQELAMAINAHAPRVLAEEAARRGILLVHYSTDYVFDGSKQGAWVESDETNPLNVYGASKLAGEEAIRQAGGKYLIFRTSWVYGPHGNNFLLTMLRLGRERDQLRVVDDQVGAPTSSIQLANATRTIVEEVSAGQRGPMDSWAGVYHMTCAGLTSWCGFAQEIFARGRDLLSKPAPEIVPIATSEYVTAARRPANSVLSNEKLKNHFNISLAEWKTALEDVLRRIRDIPFRQAGAVQ